MPAQQFPSCFSLISIVITGREEFVIIASRSELNYVAISFRCEQNAYCQRIESYEAFHLASERELKPCQVCVVEILRGAQGILGSYLLL